jgi:hypothetical protein
MHGSTVKKNHSNAFSSSAFVLSGETDSVGEVMGAGWQFCVPHISRNENALYKV